MVENNQNKHIYYEEEIDFKRVFQVIKKRRLLIYTSIVLTLTLAFIYLIIAKNYYEAKATIQIGKQLIRKNDGTLSTKYFDKAKNIKNILDARYDTMGKYRDTNTIAYIDSISTFKGSDSFLTISALGLSNKEVIKEIQKPINDIIVKHNLYINSLKETISDKIKVLKEKLNFHKNIELKSLKNEIKLLKNVDMIKIDDNISNIKNNFIPQLKEKILYLNKKLIKQRHNILKLKKDLNITVNNNPIIATMASMQIASLERDSTELSQMIIDYKGLIKKTKNLTIPNLQKSKKYILEQEIPKKESEIKKLESMVIPKLESEIEELKLSLHPPYIENTKIVGKIYIHDYPIKPKKVLVLIVSIIIGLILGVFLAFFIESLNGLKEEENQHSQNKDKLPANIN